MFTFSHLFTLPPTPQDRVHAPLPHRGGCDDLVHLEPRAGRPIAGVKALVWTCVEGSGGYTWNHEREGPSQVWRH